MSTTIAKFENQPLNFFEISSNFSIFNARLNYIKVANYSIR